MSLKPITIMTAAGSFALSVLAQDVVAACERASNDQWNQCSKIPDAVEYLTGVASTATDGSPAEVMMRVRDDRAGIIYKVTVPAENRWTSTGVAGAPFPAALAAGGPSVTFDRSPSGGGPWGRSDVSSGAGA